MCACLVSLSPSIQSREYKITESGLTIGRESPADIIANGTTISRLHAKIISDQHGNCHLEDLGSTNGVFINGKKRDILAQLNDGDLIGLGTKDTPHLRYLESSEHRSSFSFKLKNRPEWTIGRSLDCDISLSYDPTTSFIHAKIVKKGADLCLVDEGSLNGTWVDGRRIRSSLLDKAATIAVGATFFWFELEQNGELRVTQKDSGDNIQVEAIGLSRKIKLGLLKNKTKTILNGIDLVINPGEFVGILGPSGAGKSTLLKALSGNARPNEGKVLFNEVSLYSSKEMFSGIMAYVPQDDIIHQDLTPHQSLDYTAQWRLPGDIEKSQRKEIVDNQLSSLGVFHVGDSRIGDLSGGQRKRISIGLELITKPSVLFLDEPTSGMDPSTEERLMRTFKDLSSNGTTVVITTHILYNLSLLDKVVILSKGRLVYFGPPNQMLQHFDISGEEGPVKIFDLLEGRVKSGGVQDEEMVNENKLTKISVDYSKKYMESEGYRQYISDRSSMKGKVCRDHAFPQRKKFSNLLSSLWLASKSLFSAPGKNARILTMRYFNIKLSVTYRLLLYLLVPIVMGLATQAQTTKPVPDSYALDLSRSSIKQTLAYGGRSAEESIKLLISPEGANDTRSAEDIVFALHNEGLQNLPVPLSIILMYVMTAIFSGVLIGCLEISSEGGVLRRELLSGLKPMDYFLSKLPFLCGVTFLQCCVFIAICLVNQELRTFDHSMVLVVMTLIAWVSVILGLAISALDSSGGQFSVIIAIIVVLPQFLLSGAIAPDFFLGMSSISQFISGLLPARWGTELMFTAFYTDTGALLPWIDSLALDTLGFDYGGQVYYSGFRALALLVCMYTFISLFFIRKRGES